MAHDILLRACETGDLGLVKKLVIESKTDPNLPDDDGITLLHLACKRGHLNVVKWLVDKCKADINLPTKNGHAPLHLACIHNNLEIVKWLVNKCKVDPNARTALQVEDAGVIKFLEEHFERKKGKFGV
mgnify:CR=1 FL=1